jgi:hypothetical protein
LSPSRVASCKRLLRGIALLQQQNLLDIAALTGKLSEHQHRINSLGRLISDAGHVEIRLMLPLSRRLGITMAAFRQSEVDLRNATLRRDKLAHASKILLNRLRRHTSQQFEDDLMEGISSSITQRLFVQPATRQFH